MIAIFLAAFVLLATFEARAQAAVLDDSSTTSLKGAQEVAPAPSYLRKTAPPKQDISLKKEEPALSRILLASFLLAGLAAAALIVRKRRGGSPLLQNHVRLHTLGSVNLGSKARVALLSVGKEAMLLGVTEHGVSCLRSYREDELGSLTTGPRLQKDQAEEPHIDVDADVAFDELLLRANKDEALRHAEGSVANSKQTSFKRLPSKTTPKTTDDDSHELPPHLKTLLAEQSAQATTPRAGSAARTTEATRSAVHAVPTPEPNFGHAEARHLKAVGDETFGEPEGQAAELAARFAELRA